MNVVLLDLAAPYLPRASVSLQTAVCGAAPSIHESQIWPEPWAVLLPGLSRVI